MHHDGHRPTRPPRDDDPQMTDDASRVVDGVGVVARVRLARGTRLWDPLAPWIRGAAADRFRPPPPRLRATAALRDVVGGGGLDALDRGGCYKWFKVRLALADLLSRAPRLWRKYPRGRACIVSSSSRRRLQSDPIPR